MLEPETILILSFDLLGLWLKMKCNSHNSDFFFWTDLHLAGWSCTWFYTDLCIFLESILSSVLIIELKAVHLLDFYLKMIEILLFLSGAWQTLNLNRNYNWESMLQLIKDENLFKKLIKWFFSWPMKTKRLIQIISEKGRFFYKMRSNERKVMITFKD